MITSTRSSHLWNNYVDVKSSLSSAHAQYMFKLVSNTKQSNAKQWSWRKQAERKWNKLVSCVRMFHFWIFLEKAERKSQRQNERRTDEIHRSCCVHYMLFRVGKITNWMQTREKKFGALEFIAFLLDCCPSPVTLSMKFQLNCKIVQEQKVQIRKPIAAD